MTKKQPMETSNMLFKCLKLKLVSNTVSPYFVDFVFFPGLKDQFSDTQKNRKRLFGTLSCKLHVCKQRCSFILKLQYIGDAFPLHLFDMSQKVICMEI